MTNIGPVLTARQAHRSFKKALDDCVSGNRYYWAISAGTEAPFAVAGLAVHGAATAQIGCLLKPSHFGRGYATEMLSEITHYGFDQVKLNRITSFSTQNNIASDVLMQKLGYDREVLNPLPNGLGKGFSWHLSATQWRQRQAKIPRL